jgi:hypothetical protein
VETNSQQPKTGTTSDRRITRRRLTGLAFSLAAGWAVRAEATGTAAASSAGGTPPVQGPRLTRLEQERGVPLTDAQRKDLPSQLKDLQDAETALRTFPLADGGDEPDILFRPARRQPRSGA